MSNSDQSSESDWVILRRMARRAAQSLEMVYGPRGSPGVETPGESCVFYLVPTLWGPPIEAEALRLLIRSKLNDSRLPHNSIPRFWGGPSHGEQCDACDTSITKEQLVIEGIDSTHTEQKPTQFHVKCFYVWDAERRAEAVPTPTSEQRAVVTVVCS